MRLIAEYAIQKDYLFHLIQFQKLLWMLLSAEDKIFNHPGIDAKGILRATFNNIKTFLKTEARGCFYNYTTSRKKFLLTNEVSLKRKIKEAILAFRIERAYSKERILELYLNQIYLVKEHMV